MKKNFFKMAMVAAFAMVSGVVSAQTISFDDITVAPGKTTTVGVYIQTDAPEKVWATQFNPYVTDGIAITAVELNTEVMTGDGAKATLTDKSSKGFFVVGFNNGAGNAIAGLTTEKTKVGTMTLSAPDGIAEGPYTITVKAGKINELGGTSQKVNDFDVTVTVSANTGIEAVENMESNAPVYNLNGMLMNGNLQKGVYVQNGKKFIVK
jgi:hypothetical protein